jgi:hypothetical protein
MHGALSESSERTRHVSNPGRCRVGWKRSAGVSGRGGGRARWSGTLKSLFQLSGVEVRLESGQAVQQCTGVMKGGGTGHGSGGLTDGCLCRPHSLPGGVCVRAEIRVYEW